MKKHALLLWLLAVVVLPSGCTPYLSDVPTDYSLDKKTGSGLVALSTTESGLHQSFEFRLSIRGLDSDDQWVTPFMWGNQDIETGENVIPLFNFGNIKIPEGKTIGRLHLFELKAGKYEIYRYRGVASGYRKVYEPSGPFSLKFTVLPGQTVYLGNMHFTFPDPLTYRVDIRDMSGRDLKLLKRMYPAIPDDSVMKAVLKLN